MKGKMKDGERERLTDEPVSTKELEQTEREALGTDY